MGTKFLPAMTTFQTTEGDLTPWMPLLQAIAEGKTIQIGADGGWSDLRNVSFDSALCIYRVKPEPKHGSGTCKAVYNMHTRKLHTVDEFTVGYYIRSHGLNDQFILVDLDFSWKEVVA